MKKNLLLTLVLSTLVGCSNVNDLFVIKSNSKYSTDYSNYTLVSITEKEANKLINQMMYESSYELNIEEIKSFVGNFSQEMNDRHDGKAKMTLDVDYNFEKETYLFDCIVYVDDKVEDKNKLEISVIEGYLLCKSTTIEYNGTSSKEISTEYVKQYDDLESLLNLSTIVEYFTFNPYYAMPDKFTESTKYYGRELNKDFTKKGIYAPDFIKIEDGSLEIENYDIFNVDCIVNKGWLVDGKIEVSSNYYGSMKLEVSCSIE